ncbi:site-specific integrase [Desmospora profundinema]|uniref:Integrase n=1 Tax=Desmospora profundinema TaxID=1571184 RepID=A0ABU1IK39_9BACL|nr:site-specific integrase [Desmospora profundinema]MDR6224354.1 integrase [Desmospora profundinema]
MNSITPHTAIPPSLQETVKKARDYTAQAKAGNTTRAYGADWRDFTEWCTQHGRDPLPADPQTVAYYIADLAERRKPSTIQRRLSAVSQAHQAAGYDTPTASILVRSVWAGIRRAKGTRQEGKLPLLVEDLRLILRHVPDDLPGRRDRALLLVGFAGAFRRRELVSLDVGDIQITGRGMVILLRRSKTDQEGIGRKIGIPYGSSPHTCPVEALQEWLAASKIGHGPLFRPINRHGQIRNMRLSDKSVALIVKRRAAEAGLDPRRFSGHSLRAGLATTAAMAGKDERAIMEQTGHKSTQMVRRYIRDGSLFRDNAATGIGL